MLKTESAISRPLTVMFFMLFVLLLPDLGPNCLLRLSADD